MKQTVIRMNSGMNYYLKKDFYFYPQHGHFVMAPLEGDEPDVLINCDYIESVQVLEEKVLEEKDD